MNHPDPVRILVVDDEADIRDNIRDILEDLGYHVDTAEDGHAALKCIEAGSYDIALLDYKMPGMNGVELYRKIRQISPETIAIMITAYAGGDGADRARDAGTWQVLKKPIDISELLPLLEQASRTQIVLVVDDDQAFCENLWETLRDHDYRVNLAHSEAEGKEKATHAKYDTAIVDLRLQDGDGWHVVDIDRHVRPSARLVIVTGDHDPAILNRSSDVSGLCFKPIDMNHLLELIGRS